MIREAVLEDVPRLVEMGCAFRASSPYAEVMPENPAQMALTATRLIEQDTAVIFVVEQSSELTAMIGVQLFTHPMSGLSTAGEVFFWSTGGQGVRLLHQAERWARLHGARQFLLGQPFAAEHLAFLYTRFGYSPLEVGWHRMLETDHA